MRSGTAVSPAPQSGSPRAVIAVGAALAASASLVALGHLLVADLNARGLDLLVNAPPVAGRFEATAPSARLLLPLAVIALVVGLGPPAARRLGWRALLAWVAAAGWAWAVSLALLDPDMGLTGPISRDSEYLHDVPRIDSPGDFLSGFVDRISIYATHVRGHPPGLILGLWGLEQIGLGGTIPAALVMITAGALAPTAALVALREVASEQSARAAAPFVVLIPAAIWVATSGDALFAGVSAWALSLVVLATGRPGRRGDALALAGGLLFGATLMLSYGLILLATIPLAVAFARRRKRAPLLATGAALLVLAAVAVAGFRWPEGLLATRDTYYDGVASIRPYGTFLINNLAAFAIVLGPAVIAGLALLRDRTVWLLVGGGLSAVALADVSGMSKGEVERIWLPFVPWVALATCALPKSDLASRAWLLTAAGFALAFELGVLTSW